MMISITSRPNLLRALFIMVLVCTWDSPLHHSRAMPVYLKLPSLLGTWKGDSMCVGNHPACKDEVVVYRFEAIPGKSGVVMLFADKIIQGKREPMYKLEFQYDESKGTLSGEFTKRQTHGVFEYTISGETMAGRLLLLPERTEGRRIKVKRVREKEVPAAPSKDMYEG
jgi:hypothetical protein